VVASIYGALYNLWRNGSPRDLLRRMIAAWVGFAMGQALGMLLPWAWGMIGLVHIIEGTLLCWIALLMADWLRVPKSLQQD